MDEIRDTIETLNPIEIKIMKTFAKLQASKHKNVSLETVQKRLLPKYRGHMHKNIKKLIARGLVFEYRSKNYGLTQNGIKIAHQIYQQEKEEIYGFKIE